MMYTYHMGSTAIEKIDYNPDSQIMRVYFTNAPLKGYEFFAVPQATIDAFRGAESAGKYYNLHIRGNYGADKQGDKDAVSSGR